MDVIRNEYAKMVSCFLDIFIVISGLELSLGIFNLSISKSDTSLKAVALIY